MRGRSGSDRGSRAREEGVRGGLSLLLAAALLTGCASSAPAPQALPPLAPPSSAAPSAAPSASAHAATHLGAAAFVRYFYAEITRAFTLRDPDLVSRWTAPGCATCRRYIASLTRLRDNGERVSYVDYEIAFAEAPASDGRTARVEVQYDLAASVRYDATGRVIERERATVNANETVYLRRVGGAWQVTGMERS